MLGTWIKRLLLLVFIGLLGVGGWYAIKPQPIPVDIVKITRGEIETTIDEEGKTRVREVYRISAPISGKLERLTVRAGDHVEKGERLARLRPVDPPIRDARTRKELAAATATARASVRLAEAEINRAKTALEFSQIELERAERLAKMNTISDRALQQAQMDVAIKKTLLEEARASHDLRRQQLEAAKVRQLLPTQLSSSQLQDQCCIAVVAPASGTILKIATESEQVVPAGMALVDIGDLKNMEIVVDLLSSEAVAISKGTKARIENWGEKGVLNAVVRRKNPAAFTKISALGIREQRVNVVLDLVEPPEKWASLGHAYSVNVKIITDFRKDGLRLPLGALFRNKDDWAVYARKGDKAILTPVKLGTFSRTYAQVLSGLKENDEVIVYPNDRIKNGALIVPRK